MFVRLPPLTDVCNKNVNQKIPKKDPGWGLAPRALAALLAHATYLIHIAFFPGEEERQHSMNLSRAFHVTFRHVLLDEHVTGRLRDALLPASS